jgi:hypothetical protein
MLLGTYLITAPDGSRCGTLEHSIVVMLSASILLGLSRQVVRHQFRGPGETEVARSSTPRAEERRKVKHARQDICAN